MGAERGGSPSTPQPDPSYLACFLQALASPHCSLCPLAFKVFSQTPTMHLFPPTIGSLYESSSVYLDQPFVGVAPPTPWSTSSLYKTASLLEAMLSKCQSPCLHSLAPLEINSSCTLQFALLAAANSSRESVRQAWSLSSSPVGTTENKMAPAG